MSVVLPEPVPLEMPPEDVAALDELIRAVTLAGYRHQELDDGLSGPAASAPGWLGDDARAAVVQIAAVLQLVRTCQGSLLGAATRLRAHADLLRQTRAGVARLRSEQEIDFAVAWRRIAREVDYQQAAVADSVIQAVADEVRAGEQVRRNRHALLLDELAGDAAATARVLVESSAALRGGARPGNTKAVIASLAARLPGWGDGELAALGRGLAARLFGTPLDGAGLDSTAADMAVFAGRPAFAEAFLLALGPTGMRVLLRTLGSPLLSPGNSLSRVLATALAAAAAAGPGGSADQVLSARYVLPSAGDSDAVAAGMAAVLLAGGGGPSGVPTGTVADWARQLLDLEQGRSSSGGIRPAMGRGYPLNDPLGVAVAVLAGRHDADRSAGLLADSDVWQTLLGRTWGDGGAGLAAVISAAGRAPGDAGETAVRTGLGVIGAGLPLGDPSHWTVNRLTVGKIRGALGEALAAHIDVALRAMAAADGGWITDVERAVLRGVGNISVDRTAVRSIGTALGVRSMAFLLSPLGRDLSIALPAVLAPAAWVAVQEYGRRLEYALHGYEQQAHAVAKAALWQGSYGLIPVFVPGVSGVLAGMVMTGLARALGTDGRWSNGAPEGRALGPRDALAAVIGTSGLAGPLAPSVDARVRQVYQRTLAVLGMPVPPTSPDVSLTQALWDDLDPSDFAPDRSEERLKKLRIGLPK